jgi:hypothetical protein
LPANQRSSCAGSGTFCFAASSTESITFTSRRVRPGGCALLKVKNSAA